MTCVALPFAAPKRQELFIEVFKDSLNVWSVNGNGAPGKGSKDSVCGVFEYGECFS